MKKRILTALLTLCMLASFVPCAAVAYDEMKYGEYLYYRINEDGLSVRITDCDENITGDVTVPSEIDGLPVTELYGWFGSGGVFSDCTKITSVKLPNTLKNIGDEVFSRCTSLKSIEIPDSVTYMGVDIFTGCTALETVTMPNSISIISDTMFGHCENLTSVNIPNGVTQISASAFYACKSLKNISIPDSVTHIGRFCFQDCMALETIHIPNNTTGIGFGAFSGCSSLTSITIPVTITSIGQNTFMDCTSLTDVYYSGSKTEWENIDIDDRGNDPLHNATIHYGRYDPITPVTLTVAQSGGGYVLTAETDYDGAAYAASYDAEGALISVVSEPFADGTATVAPNTSGAAKIKFFVWTNTMQPITLAKDITLN